MAHGRRALGVGADHEAGVSQRNRTGSPKASHSCRKRAALSAASASIAPPRWAGVVGDDPQRAALHPRECSDHAGAEAIAQLHDGILVAERVQDPPHLIGALALLGHDLAQQPLVGRGPATRGIVGCRFVSRGPVGREPVRCEPVRCGAGPVRACPVRARPVRGAPSPARGSRRGSVSPPRSPPRSSATRRSTTPFACCTSIGPTSPGS